jgi:hypothetical protein
VICIHGLRRDQYSWSVICDLYLLLFFMYSVNKSSIIIIRVIYKKYSKSIN